MKLSSIELPNVEAIYDYAFSGCVNLTSVEIGESLKTIGVYSFMNCEKLAGLELPASLTSIVKFTFSGCADGFTITAPAGSYAAEYATTYNIPLIIK
ncbi:MAG: leucine-rich repeat domain-containing protein [Lachnospiraceae bacterium]|nr:leucine-rich repeat domain-containing protein [Lachnospiraceae bacterium]